MAKASPLAIHKMRIYDLGQVSLTALENIEEYSSKGDGTLW
jgi:hypothetical protein